MKAEKFFPLLLLPILIPVLFAGAREIVLQNGLNEYAGCEDTQLDGSTIYGTYPDMKIIYKRYAC